jgi:hypothetical protein
VVGRPLPAQEPGAVRALKAEIHLQPPVVRAVRIVPRAFVAVDAEPAGHVRRVRGAAMGSLCAVLPQVPDPDFVPVARILDRRLRRGSSLDAHHGLPAPGHAAIVVDLPHEAAVGRKDSGHVDGPLPRFGRSRRGQGEDPHQRECEHRQKPQ